MSLFMLRAGALGSLGLAILTMVVGLVLLPGEAPPPNGARARHRARSLAKSGAQRMIDPFVRWMAARVDPLLPAKARARIDLALIHAGDPRGWTPPELVAAAILAALGGGFVGVLLGAQAGHAVHYAFALALGAVALPILSVREATRARRTVVSRELPAAIDQLALAVSAGLDFLGAIRQVVDTPRDATSPLVDELMRVLDELALGQTRREALLGLADRVPVPTVVEFVQAMVQAEEKGNPVIDVLLVQAQESRMKRSASAEVAASRAGVAMTLPLFLMFGCTMLLVLGPILLSVPKGLGNP